MSHAFPGPEESTGRLPRVRRGYVLAVLTLIVSLLVVWHYAGIAGERERKVLQRAILRGMPPKRAAKPLLRNGNGSGNGANGWKMDGAAPSDADRANAMIVDLLRRTAVAGGAPGIPENYEQTKRRERARDARIGAFLFARGTIAERDQIGKRLINDGVADSFDLHTLEAVIGSLERAGKPLWREGGG